MTLRTALHNMLIGQAIIVPTTFEFYSVVLAHAHAHAHAIFISTTTKQLPDTASLVFPALPMVLIPLRDSCMEAKNKKAASILKHKSFNPALVQFPRTSMNSESQKSTSSLLAGRDPDSCCCGSNPLGAIYMLFGGKYLKYKASGLFCESAYFI
jgi:hypothetical protein